MTTTNHPTDDYVRLLDPAVRPDPYPLFARLRESGAFRIGTAPAVVLTRYADCAAVLRDPRASVDRSLARLQLGSMPIYDGTRHDGAARAKPSFLFLDPPDHTRLRRLVSKAFTPRVVRRLEPRITEIVDDLLDQRAREGRFDAVDHFAYPLPVTVICELLGVPLADEARLSAWSALLSRTLDPTSRAAAQFRADPAQIQRAGTELHAYFEELTDRRRRAPDRICCPNSSPPKTPGTRSPTRN